MPTISLRGAPQPPKPKAPAGAGVEREWNAFVSAPSPQTSRQLATAVHQRDPGNRVFLPDARAGRGLPPFQPDRADAGRQMALRMLRATIGGSGATAPSPASLAAAAAVRAPSIAAADARFEGRFAGLVPPRLMATGPAESIAGHRQQVAAGERAAAAQARAGERAAAAQGRAEDAVLRTRMRFHAQEGREQGANEAQMLRTRMGLNAQQAREGQQETRERDRQLAAEARLRQQEDRAAQREAADRVRGIFQRGRILQREERLEARREQTERFAGRFLRLPGVVPTGPSSSIPEHRREEREQARNEERQRQKDGKEAEGRRDAPRAFWFGGGGGDAGGGGGLGFGGFGAGVIGGGIARHLPGGPVAKATGGVLGALIEAFEAPTQWGALQRAVLALAQPATDLRTLAFRAAQTASPFSPGGARATLWDAKSLEGMLYSGGEEGGDPALRAMGVGPITATRMLGNIGLFGAQMPGDYMTMLRGVRAAELGPGMSTLPDGMVQQITRQAGGMGIFNLSQGQLPTAYLSLFGKVMQQAVSQGMDGAKVAESLQQSMDMIARSGASAISPETVLPLLERFLNIGTPMARSGELGAQAVGGYKQILDQFGGGNTFFNSAMAMQMSQADLKSPEGIAKFLGIPPEELQARIAGSPDTKFLVSAVQEAAGSGMMLAAYKPLMDLGAQFPTYAPILRTAQGLSKSPYEQALIMSGLGVPYELARALIEGGTTGGVPTAPLAVGSDIGVDPRIDYLSTLKTTLPNIPPNLIEDFVQSGQKTGINPAILAAVAGHESGFRQFNSAGHALTSSAGALGVMQVMPSTAQRWGYSVSGVAGNEADNIAAGAAELQYRLRQSGGDLKKALAGYGGYASVAAASGYIADVENRLKSYSAVPGLSGPLPLSPQTQEYLNLRQQAAAESAQMFGAQMNFGIFARNIEQANHGLAEFFQMLKNIVTFWGTGRAGSTAPPPARPQGIAVSML